MHRNVIPVIVLVLVCCVRALYTFEPLTRECSDIDSIDHCCSCTYCDGKQSRSLTPFYDVTPYTAPLPAVFENLGTSMSMNGLRIVADNHPDYNEDQKVEGDTIVHVIEYDKDTDRWIHFGIADTLRGEGHTLSTSKDYVIVGNPSAEKANAALYVRTPNPAWSLSMTLEEVDAGSEFGYAVDVDEEMQRVLVSDPSYRNNIGRVYVYLSYSPIILDTLDHPSAGVDTSGLRFGHCIVIQGSLALISSPGDNVNGHQSVGSVHLFKQEEHGTKWFHVKTFHPPQELHLTSGRGYGWKIALDGRYFIVGSLHSQDVEVYYQNSEGDEASFSHMQTLNAPGMTMISRFGTALDIDGTRIAVGDPNFLSSPSAFGKVFLYEYSATYHEWLHCQTFVDDSNSFHTHFGQSVALSSGRYLAVAAPDTDSPDNGTGKLWLFDLDRHEQCTGCDGEINSCLFNDLCSVCDGDNSTCAGCDGVPNSGVLSDYCGVCGGTNTTCIETQNPLNVNDSCNAEALFKLQHEPRGNFVSWSVIQVPLFGEVEIVDATAGEIKYRSKLSDTTRPPEKDVFTMHVQDTYGNKRAVVVNVHIDECLGCDGVPNSGKELDVCGVCDGDGTSCIDCDNVLHGNKIVDFCGECVDEAHANRTCLHLVSPSEIQEVQCGQKMCFSEQQWEPNYSSAHLRWSIAKEPTHGRASIGYHSGEVVYEHKRTKGNVVEDIWFKALDNYDNPGAGKLTVRVVGCDIRGCDGILGSGSTVDRCGVCGGRDECVDCFGVVHGDGVRDLCGICGGNNSTCPDKVILAEIEQQNQGGADNGGGIPVLIWVTLGVSVLLVVLLVIFYFIYFNAMADKALRQANALQTKYH